MQKTVNIYHSFHFFVKAIHWRTLAGVSVAETVPANHHVVDGKPDHLVYASLPSLNSGQ